MQTDETLSMLRDAASAFAKPDTKRVRALRGSPLGFDRGKWQEMAGQGWLSVFVPEDRGGLGLGMPAAAIIARQLGYALVPEPYVSALQASICLAGAAQGASATVLQQLSEGEINAALAWQNEVGALALDATAVIATGDAAGTRLDGASRFVPPADGYVVSALGKDGLSLFWVAADAKGLSSQREQRADGGASQRLRLEAVAGQPIAGGAAATRLLQEAVDVGLVASSAELVGNLERMLEMTLEYLRTRQQFGKAIGSFQALQHRAVDLWIQGELAKAALDCAVRVLADPDSTPSARSSAASAAKARASDAALIIGKQAIQLHGAIGMTDEYDLGLYFNRALTLSAWLGNAAEHRRRYDAMQEAA